MMKTNLIYLFLALVFVAPCQPASSQTADPLPSWYEGKAKAAILHFVKKTTTEGSAGFVPIAERIACFDHDGTLWAEQPVYFQFFFVTDRIKALAPQHPEWKTKEPYRSVIAGDLKKALGADEQDILRMLMTVHSGMTTEEFEESVRNWIATARHPRFQRPYTRCVYLPMLELLAYLRANGYKTFIVSGGGVEFMRPWVEQTYGIPPEQVIGSSGKLKYEMRDGVPVLLKQPVVNFVNDGEGKPAGIQQAIGRRPRAAFGNSDGDFQMLEWTTSAAGAGFGLVVHHDDALREWAYDRASHVGRLDRGLDEATQRGWILVSMKQDWKKIFPDD